MNIYIGNLPLEITEEQLWQEFSPFGQVISISMMNDKYIGSGQPRGYAFVSMALKSEGETAVNTLNGKVLRGRIISVIEALPLSNNKNTGVFCSKRTSHFNGKARQRSY